MSYSLQHRSSLHNHLNGSYKTSPTTPKKAKIFNTIDGGDTPFLLQRMKTNGNDRPFYSNLNISPQKIRHSSTQRAGAHLVQRSLDKQGYCDESGCGELGCLCGMHHLPNKEIKYKYPRNIGTLYQKDFKHSGFPEQTEIYIHEKNKHHLSPHKMDLTTTKQVDFKAPNKDFYLTGDKRPSTGAPLPFVGKTSYNADFPNWGPQRLLIEKRPQYPVRTLPFHGNSTYRQTHSDLPKAAKDAKYPSMSIWKSGIPFDAQSTMRSDFQKKEADKYPMFKPKYEVAETYSFPGQFVSTAQREFFKKVESSHCPGGRQFGSATDQIYFDPSSADFVVHKIQ